VAGRADPGPGEVHLGERRLGQVLGQMPVAAHEVGRLLQPLRARVGEREELVVALGAHRDTPGRSGKSRAPASTTEAGICVPNTGFTAMATASASVSSSGAGTDEPTQLDTTSATSVA